MRDRMEIASRRLEGAGRHELLRAAAAQAGTELLTSSLRSIHHRSGRSISSVNEARLLADGAERDVLLVAHHDRKPFPPGTFALTADGIEIAVWRFPHDPYLPGLPSAVDAARVRELLDELDGPNGTVQLRTRAYRPSRRAVVEVAVRGEGAARRILYLKVLAGRRADELADLHRQLAGHVPVPGVIGVARAQGILAMEALGGTTLRAALVDGGPLPEPAAFVELSERFAASELRSKRDPRGFADPTRHIDLLSGLVPDREPIIRRVAAEATGVDGPPVAVHGDLHDGQLLLHGDVVTGLLDVDGAGSGLLAEDAGNLIAHIAVIGEVRPEVRDRVEAYAAAIADAYRPRVGAASLAAATAGAWLGLATGPHRAQDANWPETTRQRIDRAAAELDGDRR